MSIILLNILSLLCVAEPSSPAAESGLWVKLLQSAIHHEVEDHHFVEGVARDPEASKVERQLAQILLEEWEIPTKSELLRKPRLIFAPKIDDEEVRRRLPNAKAPLFLVVEGTVTTQGQIEDVTVVKGSEYEWLNEMARTATLKARYRPARSDSGYVSESVLIQFYWHPQF